MRTVNEIVVHTTATQIDWMASDSLEAKIAEIRRWHRARKFNDIGYHFVIDRDGRIAHGREVEVQGAHVAGRNRNTIGVSLVGGHGSNENDKFQDNFTPEQDAALRGLISDLRNQFPAIHTISGHNEYAAKACPGFQVTAWLGGEVLPRAGVADYPTLRVGDKGEAVRIWQVELARLGYHSGRSDGRFGKMTRASTLAFQADNSLATDGIAGVRTQKAATTADPRTARDVT